MRNKCFMAGVFGAMATLALPGARLSAQDDARKLTAMDEFNIQTATDPQISPDGKKIIYVRRFADAMTDRRYSNLWIINADGGDHRALTTGNRSDSSPRWSPDMTRIAYVSDADGRAQIYVRWMDTGQTARITNLDQAPDAIEWSPDGRMISFSALAPGKGPHIAELPSPPSGAKWADPATVYDRLVYRFNGTGYLKPGYSQVFVVSADGGAARQVTTGDFPNGGSAFGPNRAVWTPDGKMIAYTGFDDRFQGQQTTELYRRNRDGTGPHSVTDKLDRDAQGPQWAP